MHSEHRKKAYQLANIGHWELDVVNEQLYWSDQIKHLHEVPLEYQPDLASALIFYEEGEPREKVQKAVAEAIEEGKSFSLESKITTAKESTRWVKAIGETVMKDGQCICIYGSMQNITEHMTTRQDLQDKKSQLRSIADNIQGCILSYQLHPDGSDEVIYASEGIEDLCGISPQQAMASTNLIWSQIFEEYREELQRSIEESAKNMALWDQKYKIQTTRGEQKWIHGKGTPRQLEDGTVQWDSFIQDVTEQKQLEEEVAQQVSLQNHILDSLPGLFFILDEDLTFTRVNQNVEELFGVAAEQLQETGTLGFVAPRVKDKAKLAIEEVLTEGYAEHETILLDANGQEHYYYLSGTYFESDGRDFIIGNGIEITDRVEAEEENIILLQEIHHRVKNNLAIISGILTMELEELPSDSYNRLSLERSVNRIHSIAKVHELLYRSSSFSQINVSEYISDLVKTITKTLQAEAKGVDIQLDVAELQMNINEVIPLGMLLNELLTNSLKYAFPDQEEGLITLKITQQQKSYKVLYRDNGRGFDRKDFEESTSFGLTIVNILLQQLKAEYEIDTDDGFEIMFTFESRKKGSHANI